MMSYFCDVGKEQHKHQISVGIAAKANVQSHALCARVCVCVYSKGSTLMGTAASSVSPTSFSLIPTSKSSNAVDSVCHCHALKASSAYEA